MHRRYRFQNVTQYWHRLFSSSPSFPIPYSHPLLPPLTINGRPYLFPSLSPSPLVVLLIDGGSLDYLTSASSAGRMPRLNALLGRVAKDPSEIAADVEDSRRFSRSSRKHVSYYSLSHSQSFDTLTLPTASFGLCSGVVPSFTNPNNVAVICGANAATTGICGNYYYDVGAKRDTPMDRAELIRCETVLETLWRRRGANVTILTAKQKLLPLLTKGMVVSDRLDISPSAAPSEGEGTCRALSVEEMSRRQRSSGTERSIATVTPSPLLDSALAFSLSNLPHYTSVPDIYDTNHSSFLLELGAAIVKHDAQRLTCTDMGRSIYYFSTTDYLQHKYDPGHPLCNDYYEVIDKVIGELTDCGCVVGMTADHGMEDKVSHNGRPKVAYLLDGLVKEGVICEEDIAEGRVRCILPITDAHLVHHAGLGGFAHLYVEFGNDSHRRTMDVMSALRNLSGVYTVMNRDSASKSFELPPDRIGDVIVVGDRHSALGSRESVHREAVGKMERLRSHGGIDEATVPMFINRPLVEEKKKILLTGKARNYDILDFMINGSLDVQTIKSY